MICMSWYQLSCYGFMAHDCHCQIQYRIRWKFNVCWIIHDDTLCSIYIHYNTLENMNCILLFIFQCNLVYDYEIYNKFPLMPMGVPTLWSAHARPTSWPPIAMSACVCMITNKFRPWNFVTPGNVLPQKVGDPQFFLTHIIVRQEKSWSTFLDDLFVK